MPEILYERNCWVFKATSGHAASNTRISFPQDKLDVSIVALFSLESSDSTYARGQMSDRTQRHLS